MKLITVLFFASLSLPAFSQTCYVDMVNSYQRVVRSFVGHGSCYEEMKECRKTIRLQPQLGGVDCVKQTGGHHPNPNPYPQPNPNPYPNPYPQPNPNPYPNPYPQPQPSSPAQCAWFDGYSHGIAQRGIHAFRVMRGIHISERFYGNNAAASLMECQKDVIFRIDAALYHQEVQYGASQTCACAWYDGEKLAPRGWHMAYQVRMNNSNVTLSSGFYGNNNVHSQQPCNQDLVYRNFRCPINR